MKDTDKVTLTFGKLKKLIVENWGVGGKTPGYIPSFMEVVEEAKEAINDGYNFDPFDIDELLDDLVEAHNRELNAIK